jgi:hypothetical protein
VFNVGTNQCMISYIFLRQRVTPVTVGSSAGQHVEKITLNGIHNCLNYCEICTVNTIYTRGCGSETHDIVPDNNTPCILPTQYIYVFCMIFRPTPIIFLTNINRFVFVMVPDCVLCEVRTRFLGLLIMLRSA